MDTPHPAPGLPASYTPQMSAAIARSTAAIARLDARISESPAAPAWQRRAMWSGYAEALRLQGHEIDENGVFSHLYEVRIGDRPLRTTVIDLFEALPDWEAALRAPDSFAWKDALPIAVGGPPSDIADHPALMRALDQVQRHARHVPTPTPWLGLPFALRDHQLTAHPLPCLAGGAKAFRFRRTLPEPEWLALLRRLEKDALDGLERLNSLEATYKAAQRAIVAEYRPGRLPALLALVQHRPLLSPQGVADMLGLSVGGASKLLERGVSAGLLVEINARRSWRQFLARDLAEAYGFVDPRRGRPRKEPPPLPPSRDIASVLDAFDQEIAEIDRLLDRLVPQAQ